MEEVTVRAIRSGFVICTGGLSREFPGLAVSRMGRESRVGVGYILLYGVTAENWVRVLPGVTSQVAGNIGKKLVDHRNSVAALGITVITRTECNPSVNQVKLGRLAPICVWVTTRMEEGWLRLVFG